MAIRIAPRLELKRDDPWILRHSHTNRPQSTPYHLRMLRIWKRQSGNLVSTTNCVSWKMKRADYEHLSRILLFVPASPIG